MDKKILELLANKPELVTNLPEWMLPISAIEEIRETAECAIAEIAGRDSIAAIIRACDLRPIKAILPTIAYSGTEHGNWEVPFSNTEKLKRVMEKRNIRFYDPVLLGSPGFWWKLCGRPATHLFKKYGFFSSCVGCHLYFHALRIPLARKLGCRLVIGGERESHDGKIKVNQIGISLEAFIKLFKKFDLELFLPLRHVQRGDEIEEIIGWNWEEGEGQLECVLSQNYREHDGSIVLHEDAIAKYFDEFALQTAEEAIKDYLSE